MSDETDWLRSLPPAELECVQVPTMEEIREAFRRATAEYARPRYRRVRRKRGDHER